MANVTTEMIKDLREKSGAGMLECKKALEEKQGDMSKAMDWLREKGIASAAKKAGRSANEGLVGLKLDAGGKKGVLAEINCETDFVAKTDDFKKLVSDLTAAALAEKPGADPAATAAQMNAKPAVSDSVKVLIGKLGENMSLARVAQVELAGEGALGQYMHSDGKLASLVALGCGKAATAGLPDFGELARDLAMQVAGANPPAQVVERSQVPPEFLAKEKEIALAQARATGKPEAILPKIAEGKVNKVLQEISLMEQAFIKNPEQKVSDLVKEAGKKMGDTISVKAFARLKVGEKQ